jgi:hypothetical protein
MRTTLVTSLAVALLAAAAGLVRADDQAEIKKLLEKAVQAQGGEEKLAKIKALQMKGKGKVHVMGMDLDFTGEWFMQTPDRMKVEIDADVMGMKIRQVQGIVGDKGWMWNSIENQTKDMEKDQMDEAKEQLYGHWIGTVVPLLKDKGFTLSPLGEMKVGDRTAVGIRVESKGHRDVRLYFDKEKALLLKSETTAKDMTQGGKEVNAEGFYSDYKETDGLLNPTKLLIKYDGKDFVEVEGLEYKLMTDPFADNVFSKP